MTATPSPADNIVNLPAASPALLQRGMAPCRGDPYR